MQASRIRNGIRTSPPEMTGARSGLCRAAPVRASRLCRWLYFALLPLFVGFAALTGLRWQADRCDDELLAGVLADGWAQIRATGGNGPQPIVLLPHRAAALSAEFSPDGRRIVTASLDGSARVWDVTSGERAVRALRHDRGVTYATFSPDGQYVATGSYDNTARVWEAATGRALTGPLWHHPVMDLKRLLPPWLQSLMPFDWTGMWLAETLYCQPLGPFALCGPVTAVLFSVDSRQLFTVADEGDGEWRARLWDVASGQAVEEPLDTQPSLIAVAWRPDGQRVVTAPSKARLWDASTGDTVFGPFRHPGLTAASFSPDGREVVTAADDGTARVWDVPSGRLITKLVRHQEGVTAARFSPDGHYVVTSSDDTTARIWDARTGRGVGPALPHGARVTAASFSPDGRYVATASEDGLVRLWDFAAIGRTGGANAQPALTGRSR